MMQPELKHFLLVPDSGTARRLRRALASSGTRTGVVMGVWSELITVALDSHALHLLESAR